MGSQTESTHIVRPFCTYCEHKGWLTEKLHGSQFQEGFPDLYIMHPIFGQRWVECKVVRNGNLKFEDSQLNKFPKWIAHGVKIWVVFGTDFRGVSGIEELHQAYLSLFKEANAPYMMNPEYRRMMLANYR